MSRLERYKEHPAWFVRCRKCGASPRTKCRTDGDRVLWTRIVGLPYTVPFHSGRVRLGNAHRRNNADV